MHLCISSASFPQSSENNPLLESVVISMKTNGNTSVLLCLMVHPQ